MLSAPASAASSALGKERPLFAASKSEPAASAMSATPPAAKPNPSGKQKLTIAGPTSDLSTLDPALVRDADSSFLVRQIFSGLVRFDEQLDAVADLADEVRVSSDGLVYSFRIAANASFTDGTPITAADAVYSLSRAVNPATAGGDLTALGGPTFLSGIKGYQDVASGSTERLSGVTTTSERELTIELSAPDSVFLMKLASSPAVIVDRRDVGRGADWWQTPNASGPFSISEFVAGDHLTLAPNPSRHAGRPLLQAVNVLLGSNAVSPFNLYQSGGVDIADVGLGGIDRVLAPDAGYLDQLRTTPLFSLDVIIFDSTQPPMDDPHVRLALMAAFPSAKVAEVTLNGHATPAMGVIPNGMLGRDWPAKSIPFDPDAAREAITKSRYGSVDNAPPIRVFVSGGGSAESLRDSVAETLGLTIEVISMEWPDYIAALSNKTLPNYELYWVADFPDPASILSVLFQSGKPDNYATYSDPAFDAALEEAAAEIDADRRVAIYQRAQQLLIDDRVAIPVLFDIGYTLVNPAVKGLVITSMGIMSLAPVWLEH
jgi:ABC-type transport system substrate-binding protein